MSDDVDSIIEGVRKLKGKEVLVLKCKQDASPFVISQVVGDYAQRILDDSKLPFRAVLLIPYGFDAGELSMRELIKFRDEVDNMVKNLEE